MWTVRAARHSSRGAVGGLARRLPDLLGERAAALIAGLTAIRAPLMLGERILRFDGPHVMGILNAVTPDSFSDGGKLIGDPGKAADAGFAMRVAGVSIVDVGGESTRPGAQSVWEGDEIARVVPVIEQLAKSGVVVSADTRKAAVMEAALAAGAHIVNDVTGLTHDPRALEVVANAGCPVILARPLPAKIRTAARSPTRATPRLAACPREHPLILEVLERERLLRATGWRRWSFSSPPGCVLPCSTFFSPWPCPSPIRAVCPGRPS